MKNKGFTLIELLVLIVIAPLLAQFIASVLVDFIGGSIYPELWPFIGLILWPFVGYILFYILVFLTSNKNKYGKHILSDSIIKDEITKFKKEVSKSKNFTENKKELNNKLIPALCGKKNILFFSNNKNSFLKKELVVIVPKDNLIWIHTLYSR